jgi:hypothetical protein
MGKSGKSDAETAAEEPGSEETGISTPLASGPEKAYVSTTRIAMAPTSPPPMNNHLPRRQMLDDCVCDDERPVDFDASDGRRFAFGAITLLFICAGGHCPCRMRRKAQVVH